MNYFTPELIARLNSADEQAANAADAEWDRRLERYEEHLRQIEPELPEHARAFARLLLHDATVCGVARRGDQFLLVLHKAIPPRELVVLTYTLLEEPFIDREALPPDMRSEGMDFQYDEFELVRDGASRSYRQAILFGNGWEVRLSFRDVRVAVGDPLYVYPDGDRGAAAKGPLNPAHPSPAGPAPAP